MFAKAIKLFKFIWIIDITHITPTVAAILIKIRIFVNNFLH